MKIQGYFKYNGYFPTEISLFLGVTPQPSFYLKRAKQQSEFHLIVYFNSWRVPVAVLIVAGEGNKNTTIRSSVSPFKGSAVFS